MKAFRKDFALDNYSMPLTSIIITTHNRPRLLSRAIESALLAGASVEVIVVDDASTDETAAVCRDLPGIKYVRVDRNQRVAGARNLRLLAGLDTSPFCDNDQDVSGRKRRLSRWTRLASRVRATDQWRITSQIAIMSAATSSGNSRPEFYSLARNICRSCVDRVSLLDRSLIDR